MNQLAGKVALITGSTHGLGLAAARLFVREGGKVVISSESQADCDKVSQEINETFPQATIAVECDVLKEGSVDKLFEQIMVKYGRIDVVCCNVGGGPVMPVLEFTEKDVVRSFQFNGQSCFLTCQRAVREMLKQKNGGSIVCTTSTAHFGAEISNIDSTYGSTYGANKRFISTLVKQIARAYRTDGIRCNAVAPGPTPEGMLPEVWGEAYKAVTPSKTLSRAIDQAEAMLYFASDASQSVSGCEIAVDGGMTQSLYLNIEKFEL